MKVWAVANQKGGAVGLTSMSDADSHETYSPTLPCLSWRWSLISTRCCAILMMPNTRSRCLNLIQRLRAILTITRRILPAMMTHCHRTSTSHFRRWCLRSMEFVLPRRLLTWNALSPVTMRLPNCPIKPSGRGMTCTGRARAVDGPGWPARWLNRCAPCSIYPR